jgi:hypothetical protein
MDFSNKIADMPFLLVEKGHRQVEDRKATKAKQVAGQSVRPTIATPARRSLRFEELRA